MNNNEQVSFNIISNVGYAKSLYMEILNKCEEKDFDPIKDMFDEADKYLLLGHKSHADLIQKEASGENTEFSLLLMHAEDQLMNAETIKLMTQKFYNLYKKER
ncbi:PTS lactose/cellobiose transporter subunit IIA [Clostridium oceanicum]|uniref:PTS lactose/cellobiose transporter subunit IIA n=1 Tax=Clostridium oceanicum TaxID=1543 RepID=A0ABP3UK48_9CLOT